VGGWFTALEPFNLMRRLIAAERFARTVLHLLAGLFTILLRFPRYTPQQRQQRVQVWSSQMVGHIGIRMVVKGPSALPGPLLLMVNHVSWLDVTSLHAARFCRFVAKADIKGWPVLGQLASGAGTLFIERASRRDAMRVVHQMADSLRASDVLAVFPEGTTSDGLTLLPFHANLFQAAIAAQAPVQPVAIEFIDAATGKTSLAPCYMGDDTLFTSVWRTLCAPPLEVHITFGEPQQSNGRDRRTWAAEVQRDVAALRGNAQRRD
jgi:1-acyl-sn-glycerol-3-phosphate acyltransferase